MLHLTLPMGIKNKISLRSHINTTYTLQCHVNKATSRTQEDVNGVIVCHMMRGTRAKGTDRTSKGTYGMFHYMEAT